MNLTNDVIRGDIDTTYHTQQRDMFTSGLAAEIGVNAFAVWHAIKGHADFQTGVCWPGIRRLMKLTGLSTDPVQEGIKTLEQHHLLRVTRSGRKNIYVARERMDVRIGKRVICTVVIDFVPSAMKDRLSRLKAASTGDLDSDDVWAHVDLLPGPGLELQTDSKTFKTRLRVDEVLNHEGLDPVAAAAAAAKRRARQILEDSGRSRPERLPTK